MANRVLLGRYSGSDYRLRVSKPGFNVLAGLSREQLIFDSDWLSTLLVLAKGSVAFGTVLGPGGLDQVVPDIITWPDPGYIPVFLPYWSMTSTDYAEAPRSQIRFRVKRTGVDYVQNASYPGWSMAYVNYIALRAPEGGVIG